MDIIFIIIFFAWLFWITYEPDPKPYSVTPKLIRWKGLLYAYDKETQGVTLWHEWIEGKHYKRINTGIVLPLDKCPKGVVDLIISR